MASVAIVEDERNIVSSLSTTLRRAGYYVEGYDNPLVALPKLILVPPSVLILNGRMPGMHGIDFVLKFRQFSKAPVIFLSASAFEIQYELEQRGMPADEYVGKPFSSIYLVRLVAGVLEMPRDL